MGNESFNLLKSAGKSIISGLANELSETGITEALIREGIPINRLMMTSSKNKNETGSNTDKGTDKNTKKSTGKKKQNKNKKDKDTGNENKQEKQTVQKNINASKTNQMSKAKFSAEHVTTEQLRDAVVWSEILGKPVSRKRRDRRKI